MGASSASTITIGNCWCGHEYDAHVPACGPEEPCGGSEPAWCVECWTYYIRYVHDPHLAVYVSATSTTITVAADA